MAEALGVIASAVQIADTSIKLRKLWMGVREMPDTVRDVIEDIDLLANTLAQIQNVPIPSSTAQQNTLAWKECCRTLQTVNTSFQAFVSDLDNHMTTHKKSGPVKAFLKRDKIIEWQERLSRLKMTMLLAQQAYTQALFAQQFSTIIDTLQATTTSQLLGLPTPQPTIPTTRALDNSDVCTNSGQPVSRVANSSTEYMRTQGWRRFNIRLPDWILRKGLQILVGRSYGLWTFNLRMYTKVSYDSEVFTAAGSGDWTKVQCLFEAGKASPFDVHDVLGSLMHVAARNADGYGCRFLLERGLEPNPQINYYLNPLECLGVFFLPRKLDLAGVKEVVRILAPSFEDYVLNGEEHFIGFYELPIEAVRHLTTEMSSTYGTIEPLRRARSLATFRGADPESIPLILGADLPLSRAIALMKDHCAEDTPWNHRDILQNLATRLVLVMSDSDTVQALIDKWHSVMTEVITAERQGDMQLLFPSFIRHFILICLYYSRITFRLHEHGSIWSQRLTSAIRIWIKFLLALGVDMENYIKAERQYHCFRTQSWFHVYKIWGRDFAIRLNGLTCGPNVEDWSLYAVMADDPDSERCGEEYEMAGAFWEWVENPELFLIPGTYPSQPDKSIDYSNCVVKGPVF